MEGMNLVKLEWCGKNRAVMTNKDVSLSLSQPTDKKRQINFTFRNDTADLFSSTGYMEFAVYKNRVFFKESNDTGLKLSNNKNVTSTTKYMRVSCDTDVAKLIPFIDANYELKFDPFYELYYIENLEMNK